MRWNGNTPGQDVPILPPDICDGMGIHHIKTSPYHPQTDAMEWEYTTSRRPRTTPRQMRCNGNTPDQDVPVPPPDRWDGIGIHQIKTSPYHPQTDAMEWEYTTPRQMRCNGNTPDQDVPVPPPDRWDGIGIHQIKTSPYHPQTDAMEWEYTRSRRPRTTPKQMGWLKDLLLSSNAFYRN